MDRDNELQVALELSDQILTAIDQQSWDVVAALDVDRQRLIERYFQQVSAIDEKLAGELKQKNDRIVSLLISLQQKIQSEQISLNKSNIVSKAYLGNV